MIIGQLERTEQVSHAAATEAERLMHSLTGKLATGSAWAFTGKIASAFCGLAANAILARLLIPEALGMRPELGFRVDRPVSTAP